MAVCIAASSALPAHDPSKHHTMPIGMALKCPTVDVQCETMPERSPRYKKSVAHVPAGITYLYTNHDASMIAFFCGTKDETRMPIRARIVGMRGGAAVCPDGRQIVVHTQRTCGSKLQFPAVRTSPTPVTRRVALDEPLKRP